MSTTASSSIGEDSGDDEGMFCFSEDDIGPVWRRLETSTPLRPVVTVQQYCMHCGAAQTGGEGILIRSGSAHVNR